MPTQPHRSPSGFTLLETALVLGAMSALSLSIYLILRPTTASAQIKGTAAQVEDVAQKIEDSFGLLGNYQGVSTQRVIAESLYSPSLFRVDENSVFVSKFGTPLRIEPRNVARPNDAFAVVVESVPAEACAPLAQSLGTFPDDVQIRGNSVMGPGGVNMDRVMDECADLAPIAFVFYSPGLVATPMTVATGPAVALPPSSSLPLTNENITVNPAGPAWVAPPASVGPVSQGTSTGSPSGPSVPTWSPPSGTTPAPTALPPGWVDPTVIGLTCQERLLTLPLPAPQERTLPCPVGQTGSITERQVSWFECPGNEAWVSPDLINGAWTVVSNTCVTPCGPAPATTQTVSVACSTLGMGYTSGTAWVTQGRTVTPTGACTYNEGAWVDQFVDTSACGFPPPPPPTCGAAPALPACPSGWSDTRSLVFSPWPSCWSQTGDCVSPTPLPPASPPPPPACGPAPATPSCPAGWTNTHAWTLTTPALGCWTLSGTCLPPPPPPSCPASAPATPSCPSGWTNSHAWNPTSFALGCWILSGGCTPPPVTPPSPPPPSVNPCGSPLGNWAPGCQTFFVSNLEDCGGGVPEPDSPNPICASRWETGNSCEKVCR